MTTSPSAPSATAARLSPSLVFSLLDQFQRRSELCTGRLIGAIYGSRVEEEGVETVTVKQAFPIPHSEVNEQVRALANWRNGEM